MADNLLSSFLPDDRAATGFFPQMKPRRRLQDVQGSANVPLDVTRGRVAGLAGLLPDVLNFMGRSPMPTEQFGETQYEPAQQLPYGSEYFLQNLPLKPTSRIGEVAGQAGAFVPLNPMPAARAVAAGARALGPTAVRMGEGYLQRQGLMPELDVYHGSPYKFDRFDASKIGSGEGAQSYGHGLYFAEVPEVAKGYQTALAGKDGTATGHAAQVVNVYGGDYEKALKHLKSIQPAPGETTFSGESHELIRDAIKAIQSGAYKSADKGSLYKVDLPDEQIAKMLDWDKPLSKQSKEVQAAMDRAFQLHLGRIPQVNKDTFTGAQAYEMLTGGTSGMQGYENIAAQGSKALRQAGIPGIKYLDQQSRNAGGWHLTSPDNTVRGKWMLKSSDYNSNGVFFDTQQEAQSALKEKLGKETRNFVTFPGEEQSMTILERNGQPVQQNRINSFIQ